MKKLYPSLMCVDFSILEKEILALNATEIYGYHIDIMDGQFVPNFTLGINDIYAVNKLSCKELDVHLMVNNPDLVVPCFLPTPAHRICFHVETAVHSHRIVEQIRKAGKQAGVAINPGTTWRALEPLLPSVDFVLIMSVDPGFAGQQYIESTTEKIRQLIEYRKMYALSFEIEVDGAMSPDKVDLLYNLGVEGFVLGTSAIFGKSRSYIELVNNLLASEEKEEVCR